MMRILMLNYEYPPLGGGAANANYYLLKEFEKFENIEIDLITSSTGRFKTEKPFKNTVIHFLDIGKSGDLHHQNIKELLLYSYKAFGYAKKLKKQKNFDFIHSFFGIPCGYIASLLKLPYLVSLMGSDVPFHTAKYFWLDKLFFARLNKNRIWKHASFVISNSEGLAEEVWQTAPKQPLKIIVNGIDTDYFAPAAKEHHKNLRLISVGRITEHKGYRYLLEALRLSNNYELKLVGDGPDIDQFKDFAHQNNINVAFLGRVEKEEICNQLQQADVFILPSLNEGMSNAALEAMACGLPIIMTDVGGAKELIKDNGIIIKRKSVQDIKHAIDFYQTNRDARALHSMNSRKLAEMMSWEKVAAEHVDLYKKMV